MSSSFATIPKTAPFAEEEIDLLNRVVGPANATAARLAGGLPRRRRVGHRAGAACGAGASGRADHDRLRQRVRQLREARQRSRQGRAQERPEADPDRHGRSRTVRSHEGQAPGVHRRHLGRGRAAGARGARLWRIDGRGRAAPRRRRIRRAGARRHGLRGILRHRQEDRRAAGRAGRKARGRARRLRSRFRRAGVALDRRCAESSRAARRRPRAGDRGRFRQAAGCAEYRHRRGRDQRARESQFLALEQGNHPSRARLRRRHADLRAGRLARSLCGERSGICR